MNSDAIIKRLDRLKRQAEFKSYPPVVFLKQGQGYEGPIGPDTVVFIDDVGELD
jgi:hypothetical protein